MAATYTTRLAMKRFIQITSVSLLFLASASFAAEKADAESKQTAAAQQTAAVKQTTAAAANQSNASAWTAAKGWNGLVVGKSTLKQAKSKLGKLYNTEMVAGSKCYNFKDAKVNIFIDEKTKIITKIWVSGDLKDPSVPKTIKEAMKMYGELGNKGPSGSGGFFYEKPGLSMLSSTKGPPDGVAWMEFFKAK